MSQIGNLLLYDGTDWMTQLGFHWSERQGKLGRGILQLQCFCPALNIKSSIQHNMDMKWSIQHSINVNIKWSIQCNINMNIKWSIQHNMNMNMKWSISPQSNFHDGRCRTPQLLDRQEFQMKLTRGPFSLFQLSIKEEHFEYDSDWSELLCEQLQIRVMRYMAL